MLIILGDNMYSLNKLKEFNEIIRKNPRTTRFLEREGLFPVRNIEVKISNLNKDDYSFLLENTGEENTNYLINLLNKFDRNWVVYNDFLIKPANGSLNLDGKKLQVARDLTHLVGADTLDVSSFDFFKSFENFPYKNSMEGLLKYIKHRDCVNHKIQYSIGGHKGLLKLGLEYNKIFFLK